MSKKRSYPVKFLEENMKRLTAFAAALALSFGPAGAGYCATTDDVMMAVDSMKRQMAQMQQTISEQNAKIRELEIRTAEAPSGPTISVPPTSTGEMSDQDFQTKLKDNVGSVIPWLKGAKYGGDFRLRMENFDYYNANDDAGSTGTAASRNRNRFRYRLRYGFEKDYGDDWKVGFRLATGSTTDQTSTNQTLGNTSHFNYDTIIIDRAYATYSPTPMKDYGPLKGLTVGAGKFDNPFLRYSTPIVWDGDVTPEGLYEKATIEVYNTEENKLFFDAVLGQFITNENTGTEQDAGLYGYQGALRWTTYSFTPDTPVTLAVATSYYDYTNWNQTIGATNATTTSYLRTNTLLADNFRVLDIYPELQFTLFNTPTTVWYDYATNVANVGTEDDLQSLGNDIHDADEAWGFGVKFGKPLKKGDWEINWGYYEIGGNAVVAAFNDSDFGGPGQVGATNRIGHKFGGSYLLTDSISLGWTGILVRPLHPSALVASSTNEDVFRSQLDLNFKF